MADFDLRAIVERLPLVVYVDELDERSTPRYVSPQIERLVGYTQKEWLADPELFVRSIHPSDRERVLADIAARKEGGAGRASEYRLLGRDGRIVWVRDDEVVVDGVAQGSLQDITSDKLTASRLELLASVFELAAEELPPERLVAEIADRLAAAIGDVTVTFVELTPEGIPRPRYSTSEAGLPEALPGIPASLGALEHGPLVIDDVFAEAWLESAWKALAARGVRSAVDVPLTRNGRLVGAMWFNTPIPRRWSAAEVQLLTEVATQLGIVLERSEARERRLAAEAGLRSRDAILEAVTHAAERFLTDPNLDDAFVELMRSLGVATGVTSAYVYENVACDRPVPMTLLRAGWCREDSPQAGLASRDPTPHFARWAEILGRGDVVDNDTSELPPDEREAVERTGSLSLLAVPIFVAGRWWGHIGFEDFEQERDWSPAETDALRLAASLVAAAIERLRAEAVLHEHEQKLEAVFDTALDAIFITDDERRYVDVNPAACSYLGVARHDLVGRRIDEFLPPDKLATVEEDWAAYVAGGPILAEWETQRADGSVRTAEASANPNFLPGLHIAFFRDVTDRKRLESELLSAQKLESLGRLAGGVAHDFNNLMTGITGYASLLLERTQGDPELQRDLGEIKRAGERAAELTKQLLAFGRRQVLQPRPLDLNKVVMATGSLLQRLLGDQIELVLLPGHELGIVRADPGQIEQVIVNLAMNARDAMRDSGRVTIETRNADDGYVELTVTDDGVGMDEATLSQIFEPFFSTREQGVGLGLASVHGIVHQSGGQVRVESSPGEGSVFTVRLPRVHAIPDSVAEPAAPAGATSGSETILLVEDEDVVRDLTRRVLERQGYTVLACADGAEAVAVAASDDRTIDLLLTDMVMPGLRGHEVAHRVAAGRPEIKILYMSGYAEETLVGGSSIAAGSLIEKPFAIDALALRVREALER